MAPRRLAASLAALLLLLTTTGCTALFGQAPTPVAVPAGIDLYPTRLQIPSIGVDTSLEPLWMNRQGELRPPRDPDLAGWFIDSVVPGNLGAAVVAGHLDSHTGPAVFWRLSDLRHGDKIRITRSDGMIARFTVAQVRQVKRAHFPTSQVYGPTPDRELRLITCGGQFDLTHGHYLGNVLVRALAY